MHKNQNLKKVFDYEFNRESMKKQILFERERREEKNRYRNLKYMVPVCMVMLCCGVLFFNHTPSKLQASQQEIKKDTSNIRVNTLLVLGEKRIDAEMKNIAPVEGMDILKDITIPNDLEIIDRYAIYTRKEKTNDYTILNSYVYSYFNQDTQREIRISFSDKNQPMRDYYFNEQDARTSYMNHCALKIYQYEDTYFTAFKYKDYNFDIETNKLTLEELESLLQSIIQ